MILKAQRSNALVKSGKLYEVDVCQAKNPPHDIFYRIKTGIEACPFFDVNAATLKWYFGDLERQLY